VAYLDVSEYERWMKSAIRTLKSAEHDVEHGDYNWACFKAHQAAERALKALLWGVGVPRTGHSLTHLLNYIAQELGLRAPDDVRESCLVLDKHYVPTRYPNAWAEGTPEDYYFEGEARSAIARARRVVEWVEGVWRESSRRGGR
jgi:HEPN domain-containing protein